MKKKVCIISILPILLISILLWVCYNHVLIKPADYNRAMYSVVLFNNTSEEIHNISVLYQHGSNNTITEVESISSLLSGSYKKVNIPTDVQENGSYDVYVKYNNQNVNAGYFGTNVGGFVVIEFRNVNGILTAENISSNSVEYKKLYRRHIKNQYETAW